MATFHETRAPTSIKYAAEQDITMPNLSQSLQLFWSHSSVFALEKYPKNQNFRSIFASKKLSLAIFSEMCALTSRYVAQLGIVISNLLRTLQHFCL